MEETNSSTAACLMANLCCHSQLPRLVWSGSSCQTDRLAYSLMMLQLKANLSARASHDQLERELAALGLRVKKITADGNCFFRALGDQLKAGGTT